LLVEDLSQDQPYIAMWIPKGKGKHHMRPIADNFKWEDVQIKAADGQMVGGGDTVTVYARIKPGCELTTYVIE
jgi:hypothetical protein